jgi:putative glycosyltransferase (TIGR04348 family)
MPRPHILIVSPASASENNGNWQTASRWMRFLRARYRVTVAAGWDLTQAPPDLLIALHARRSAAALAAFRAAHPARPALLVLTGTDLYRDIHQDAAARASLDAATALVVLQPQGLAQLAPEYRARTRVIYQSAPRLPAHRSALLETPRAPRAKQAPLDIIMIGHLRPEKDPLTYMRAAGLVTLPGVRLLHVGAALDPALADAARATEAATPRYRWLGALPHWAARRRLRRCHAMAIASTMEGGANVIIEAVTSGVAVLASDIGGNRGMLGEDYAGLFPTGDAGALARLVERSVREPRFHARLFVPAAEQARLRDLVDNLLSSAAPWPPHGAAFDIIDNKTQDSTA